MLYRYAPSAPLLVSWLPDAPYMSHLFVSRLSSLEFHTHTPASRSKEVDGAAQHHSRLLHLPAKSLPQARSVCHTRIYYRQSDTLIMHTSTARPARPPYPVHAALLHASCLPRCIRALTTTPPLCHCITTPPYLIYCCAGRPGLEKGALGTRRAPTPTPAATSATNSASTRAPSLSLCTIPLFIPCSHLSRKCAARLPRTTP